MRRSIAVFLFLLSFKVYSQSNNLTFPIVDTEQTEFYNNTSTISEPSAGDDFYGQDANFSGFQPSYTDNNDGTITDSVTGLMWQKGFYKQITYSEILEIVDTISTGGYDDWRLPTIKEMYSLILFTGIDPSGWNGTNTSQLTPFIDTDYFDFEYGDTDAGQRIIDAQYATSTEYVDFTMNGDETLFGVNFADGRIKGYPKEMNGSGKVFMVKFVRGNPEYGINIFKDNGDGTITDSATGLMWQQDDSKTGYNWKEALAFVQTKNSENYLGYNDWRLPNVKELQSLLDYSKSPATDGTAAIDDLFVCTEITVEDDSKDFPFYWSGTTHENMTNGNYASYVCFGTAYGFMSDPMNNYNLLDVHGAGSQRSDPKEGDPADYPTGYGPQGDVIRIYNYVRLVRDAEITTSVENEESTNPQSFRLEQNYPNPFNPSTTIQYSIPGMDALNASATNVSLKVFDVLGNEVAVLVNESKSPGTYSVNFNAANISSGVYLYVLTVGDHSHTKSMMLKK